MLRRWVANGGILWTNNNTLSFFGITYVDRRWFYGGLQCQPTVAPHICPILTDCSRGVVVSKSGPAASNLNYKNVIPLLTGTVGSQTACYWSLVPYGRGWISDVKTVDVNRYDGARFWLNFRLFCLGEGKDIPGAPKAPESAKEPSRDDQKSSTTLEPSQPTIINTAAALEKALADAANQKVIWLQLARKDVSDRNLQNLVSWVRNGGVLWTEIDIAKLFGSSPLRETTPSSLSGTAEVAMVNHPIASGLAGNTVGYALRPGSKVITGRWLAVSQSMIPLLVQRSKQSDFVTVICALRHHQKGILILRPARIDTSSEAASRFEENLRSFSFKPTKAEIPPILPPDQPSPRQPRRPPYVPRSTR